jgi:hypothetical protein
MHALQKPQSSDKVCLHTLIPSNGSVIKGFQSRGLAIGRQKVIVPEVLSDIERQELECCEKVIASGLQVFFQFGRALLTIKNRRLYRTDYATFENYCRIRWNISRFYAYRLIGAAEVTQRLLTFGNKRLPKNEAQARPLTRVAPELVPKVWEKALEFAGEKEISPKHVNKALSEVCEKRNGKSDKAPMHEATSSVYSMSLVCGMITKLRKQVGAGETEEALLILEKLRIGIERLRAFNTSTVVDEEGGANGTV